MDKERNGQADKQANRQIDKRENREKQKTNKADGGYFMGPSFRGPNNSIPLSFYFVPGSLGLLDSMLLSL